MSLALIQESAKEVRRLAIAGSTLAVGDFRLKKLIAPLEQVGASVPVFGQVAKAISELVNGKEADSAANLLSLSTLLNAILYTQGQAGTQGGFKELQGVNTGSATTRTSARVLKPLVEALTNSGAGRFEMVTAALERGAFSDLRLIEPSIRALDDSYPELAELITDKVLPGFGAGIAPLLQNDLELKGKKSDARRLRIIHRLDKAGALDLCKKALDEGSAEVKIAAIGCLGQHEDCLPLLLEHANSKNKQIRSAALGALAAYDRSDINNLLIELIKGKSLDMLAEPLRANRSAQVLEALLAEGKRAFDLVIKGEAEHIIRFWEVLNCLDGRKDGKTEQFLLACLSPSEKLAKLKPAKNQHIGGDDLVGALAGHLYDIGSPKAFEAILSKRESMPPMAFVMVLRSAARTWPPEKIYDEFSPLLTQKKGAGKEKLEVLQQTIWATSQEDESGLEDDPGYVEDPDDRDRAQALKAIKWDPRWLDAALKANNLEIVCRLARPGHKESIAFLLKAAEGKDKYQIDGIMRALARCQYPKLTDFYLELVAKRTKGASAHQYETQMLMQTARHLPVADLPKLEAFIPKLDEKLVDAFVEALEPLRQKLKPAEAQSNP